MTPQTHHVGDSVTIPGTRGTCRILAIDRTTQTATLTQLGADPRIDQAGVPLKALAEIGALA